MKIVRPEMIYAILDSRYTFDVAYNVDKFLLYYATTPFPCSLRPGCTRGKHEPRTSRLQAREYFEALQSAHKHQKTEAFRASYSARARIEGTHAQAISRCGLRRCRYIGLAKTCLQHVLTTVAVNLVRVAEWCAGIPVAKTCCSRFAAF